ncbi:MAG: P-loop NTPase, partial [Acidobacteria bacterium]|nr:P-loop NTPase [Acidobacteriota bacterium]
MPATVISVCSAKGGAGKTLLAVNFAISLLRESRARVALVEATYPVPGDVPLYLGLERPKAVTDILPLLERLQPALLRGFLTHHSSGIAVIPAAADSLVAKQLAPEKLERFVGLVAQAYDFLVIDVGGGIHEGAVDFFDQSDLISLVMTPEVSSLTQTKRAVDYLQSFHFPRDMMRLVLNRYSNRIPFPPD